MRQQVLWNNLSNRLGTLSEPNICVCGDFNAVRCMEERRSVGSVSTQGWSANFNKFIKKLFWWTFLFGVAISRGFGVMGIP